MRRLIIARIDNQLGPQPLHQYPPSPEYPPKERFLKIWALHETEEDNNFIYFTEENRTYLSISKKKMNVPYFIIIELDKFNKKDLEDYRDILEIISQEILNNIETQNISHIIRDSYNTIVNVTQFKEFDIFLRLFEDKTRILILELLQKGTYTKDELRKELKRQYGITNPNLDLLLTPFLRLNLIEIRDLHGQEDVILLKNDFGACRIPPKLKPKNENVLNEIKNMFMEPTIIPSDEIIEIVKVYKYNGVNKLIEQLEQNPDGSSIEETLSIIGHNEEILNSLKRLKFIHIENEKVYLICKLHFSTFSPLYLVPILYKRYKNNEISLEQLISQLSILTNNPERRGF